MNTDDIRHKIESPLLSERTQRSPNLSLCSSRVKWITDRFKSGLDVSDSVFDGVIDYRARRFTKYHWTPVAVGRIAAELFSKFGNSPRILDVGSGCGKATTVMALAAPTLHVTGAEQRKFLLRSAVRLTRLFELQNTSFIEGNAFDMSWDSFNCFYFFNPFYEHKIPQIRMTQDITFSSQIYDRYVKESYRRLKIAQTGSVVVTYWGFGGLMPSNYKLELRIPCGTDSIHCWRKIHN